MEGNSALSLWLSILALTGPYLESGAVQGGVEVSRQDLHVRRSDSFKAV